MRWGNWWYRPDTRWCEKSLEAACPLAVIRLWWRPTFAFRPIWVCCGWDATRVAVRVCSKLAKAQGLAGWRQRRHLERQLRHRFQRVCTSRRWKRDPQGVKAYLSGCRQLRQRIAATLDPWAMSSVDLSELRRRVSLGTSLEDQHQFILDYRIMWEGSDVDSAIPLVESCKQRYPELTACSFDRGFYSPSNRSRLEQMLEVAALPAQGRLSPIAKAREREARFAAVCSFDRGFYSPSNRSQMLEVARPAVESAIHHLESHGLDRIRTHGRKGFARTVALAILAANLHRLGTLLLARDRKRERRRSRALLQAA